VPTYPASHGCVRITDPAMDRLYDLLRIGTPVTIYAG
jgi:lipoprotein-anchoring transpeptidase ErfK/SrfK